MRANLGEELAQRAEAFLEHLLGAPAQRHRREWRYGRRGSLSCTIAGEKRGLYFDHEAGEGGDLVQLAARVRGCSLSDAARSARQWLGASASPPPSRRPRSAQSSPHSQLATSPASLRDAGEEKESRDAGVESSAPPFSSPAREACGGGGSRRLPFSSPARGACGGGGSRRLPFSSPARGACGGGGSAEGRDGGGAADAPANTERLHLAIAIWNACRPARGTLAENYLRARGLELPYTDDLRFHPNLLHAPTRTERPALLALMRDIKTNAPTGIHRTFLSDDGTTKAKAAPQKMMLGRSAGACVKLAPDDEVTMGLTVAEGIETALAAMQMQAGSIAWATLSANGLRRFPLLGGIECLTVCADNDETGLTAARECAARWRAAGCEVRLRTPGAHEADWADVAQSTVQPETRP